MASVEEEGEKGSECVSTSVKGKRMARESDGTPGRHLCSNSRVFHSERETMEALVEEFAAQARVPPRQTEVKARGGVSGVPAAPLLLEEGRQVCEATHCMLPGTRILCRLLKVKGQYR